jgi:hypothetical protein
VKETNTRWAMNMIASIKETYWGGSRIQSAVRIQECGVAGGTCHGTVVSMGKDRAGCGVVGSTMAAKQKGGSSRLGDSGIQSSRRIPGVILERGRRWQKRTGMKLRG